jgi:exosome complex exonuclease RRP6
MLTATLSYSQIAADPTPSNRTGETQVEDINTHAASGMQVEIPYVPAAQRLTTIARAKVEEKDTIVMVGQKKRKRVKGGGKAKVEGEDSPSPSIDGSKGVSETNAEQAPFDFSAVPNILDDNPDAEDKNRKKKRQRKQNKGML